MSEITITKTNSLFLEDTGLYLEAFHDKILVLSDPYKSGYECKTCNGEGKVKSGIVEGAKKDCPDCGGKGHVLVVPETAKTTPTSGMIVSIGENCKILSREKHLGQRVLIGPYVGTGIPIKGQMRIRSLREEEVICFLWGTEVEDKDFIEYTPDIN